MLRLRDYARSPAARATIGRPGMGHYPVINMLTDCGDLLFEIVDSVRALSGLSLRLLFIEHFFQLFHARGLALGIRAIKPVQVLKGSQLGA